MWSGRTGICVLLCCFPLWWSTVVICVTVDCKTWLISSELSGAPALCLTLSRCLLNTMHGFEIPSTTDKKANFQGPNSQISFILSEPRRGVFRYRFAKVKHLSALGVGGCFTAKLDYDMRFLQSLSFLLSSVAWLNNVKLEFVPFVCIPACHFHDNYSVAFFKIHALYIIGSWFYFHCYPSEYI